MDRTWIVKGYPLPELRLVPERLSEHIYGHFVANSTDSSHHGFEPF